MHDPALENPTLVVLTDRNDLDNQLFATFGALRATCFGEDPVQAENIDDLQAAADRAGRRRRSSRRSRSSGRSAGEDDFPELTDRSNVIVIVDEAHRSQYGFDAKMDRETGEMRYGFAHHLRAALPKAIYVGFTGTPVELVERQHLPVFGDYIDVYDIAQAVEDGATVPIYYEARVARIEIAEDMDGRPRRASSTRSRRTSDEDAAGRRAARDGRGSRRWSAPRSGSTPWSPTSWTISTSASRQSTARR